MTRKNSQIDELTVYENCWIDELTVDDQELRLTSCQLTRRNRWIDELIVDEKELLDRRFNSRQEGTVGLISKNSRVDDLTIDEQELSN